ncbi:MAG TPA: hypothetical protein VGH02_16430 [Rhizomicrobium sp.]|jgi:DNA/RNA endonuclease YhcR with UshA esterase domain
MKALALCFVLALTAMPAAASVISPSEAMANVGRRVTVEGVVIDGYHENGSGQSTLVFAEGEHAFNGIYYEDTTALFPDPRELIGKTVRIHGTVQSDFGTPDIVLRAPTQLQIDQ